MAEPRALVLFGADEATETTVREMYPEDARVFYPENPTEVLDVLDQHPDAILGYSWRALGYACSARQAFVPTDAPTFLIVVHEVPEVGDPGRNVLDQGWVALAAQAKAYDPNWNLTGSLLLELKHPAARETLNHWRNGGLDIRLGERGEGEQS